MKKMSEIAQRTFSGGKKMFECGYCPKRFSTKLACQGHIRLDKSLGGHGKWFAWMWSVKTINV